MTGEGPPDWATSAFRFMDHLVFGLGLSPLYLPAAGTSSGASGSRRF